MSFAYTFYWFSNAELIYKSFNQIEKENNLVDAPTSMISEPKYKIPFGLCCLFSSSCAYFLWGQPLKAGGLLVFCHSSFLC